MARQPVDPHDNEPAFVLHAYPYRETSLIVEAFTPGFGRVSLVAKGAKRPRSEMRGLLQAFQPLVLSWSGAGELKTLTHAEWRGGLPLVTGAALLCGFYLNELLLKLLAKEDAHAPLFEDYARALDALAQSAQPAAQAAVLRRFEVRLLAELGYGLALTHDVDTGAPIDASRMYHYVPDRGAYLLPPNVAHEPAAHRGLVVRGATLLALSANAFDADSAAEAKRLMREVLDHHLEERRIVSRRVVRDLMALEEEKEKQ